MPQPKMATANEHFAPVDDDIQKQEAIVSSPTTSSPTAEHAAPEETGVAGQTNVDALAQEGGWFAYLKTRNFYVVLILGQVLALCITGTNTFSSLLAAEPFSIPAFQTFWNYVLLNLIYTTFTIYKYGFKGYGKLLWKDGWKYIILAFFDVEGNYFTVLAYRYTTILSAQLINFWAIVIVVLVSFVFLKVRYHWTQIVGILVCIGGVGILFGSDHITQGSGFGGVTGGDQLKGDLFALLGATLYGLSNVFDEFLVSKRPLYEVIGQLGFWGMIIGGAQTGIFDRPSYATAVWNSQVGGYLTGFTFLLTIFYTGAPIMFRMSSAAFFNISLLTGNFWGVVVGVEVFHLSIHWMYPIAFVCIIGGLIVYFLGKNLMGEARKPWLGMNQERGEDGLGTARRKVVRGDELHV